MQMLVSALIGQFGSEAYNVTMLYGDAESYMMPLSASELKDFMLKKMACELTRKLVLSDISIPDSAFFFDCETYGSLHSAKFFDYSKIKSASNQFILASFDRIGHDELTALLDQLQSILSTHVFDGKFEYRGILLHSPFEKN